MNGQSLAVLSTVPAAFQLLMMRHVARGRRKYNAAVMNAISLVTFYLIALLCLPLLGTPNFADARAHVGLLLLNGVLFTGTVIFMWKGLEHLAAGVFSILNTVATLFTIALAVPLLHESFRHYQWVGAAILMITIWATLFLANREDPHLEKTAHWKVGVAYCMASSLCVAAAWTNEKHLLSLMSPSTYAVYEWGTQLAVAVVTAVWLGGRRGFRDIVRSRTVCAWVVGSGVMRAVSAVLFILAQVYSNNIALVSVISNFKIIIIAIIGALALGERKFLAHKLATAAMAIGGLTLLIGL